MARNRSRFGPCAGVVAAHLLYRNIHLHLIPAHRLASARIFHCGCSANNENLFSFRCNPKFSAEDYQDFVQAAWACTIRLESVHRHLMTTLSPDRFSGSLVLPVKRVSLDPPVSFVGPSTFDAGLLPGSPFLDRTCECVLAVLSSSPRLCSSHFPLFFR